MKKRGGPIMREEHRLNVAIGLKIRLLRFRAGRSQAWLARAIGVSRPSAVNLEAGRMRIPITRFVRVAEVLGVDPAVLLPAGKPWEHRARCMTREAP